MICKNYCLVCFGLFLVFQRIPGDPTTSAASETNFEDMYPDIPFNPVCPDGCATCSTYNGCVTCQTTHFLLLQWQGMRQTGTCVKACPVGYFGTRKRRHGKCFKCPISNCDECSSNATCTGCATPSVLADGRCLDRCPKSKPFPAKSRFCQKQVDCEVSPWSTWEPCSRNGAKCGTKPGRQARTRQVLQEPSPNGEKCPTTVQSRKCKLTKCECKGVETTETNLQDVTDSAKKSKKPQKGCKQRKNKKKPTKNTPKREELLRKLTATPKSMKKTTTTTKKMTTSSS